MTHATHRLCVNAMLLALLFLLVILWLLPVREAYAGGLTATLGCEVRDTSWVKESENDFCVRALPRGATPASRDFFYYWRALGSAGSPAAPAPALVLRLGAARTEEGQGLLGWLAGR